MLEPVLEAQAMTEREGVGGFSTFDLVLSHNPVSCILINPPEIHFLKSPLAYSIRFRGHFPGMFFKAFHLPEILCPTEWHGSFLSIFLQFFLPLFLNPVTGL